MRGGAYANAAGWTSERDANIFFAEFRNFICVLVDHKTPPFTPSHSIVPDILRWECAWLGGWEERIDLTYTNNRIGQLVGTEHHHRCVARSAGRGCQLQSVYFLHSLLDMGSVLGVIRGTILNYKEGPLCEGRLILTVALVRIRVGEQVGTTKRSIPPFTAGKQFGFWD